MRGGIASRGCARAASHVLFTPGDARCATLPLRIRTPSPPYAATTDGQRFIVNAQAQNPNHSASFVVLNWPDLIRP